MIRPLSGCVSSEASPVPAGEGLPQGSGGESLGTQRQRNQPATLNSTTEWTGTGLSSAAMMSMVLFGPGEMRMVVA